MKYLKITLHDTDFYREMDWLGKHLLNYFADNSTPFDTTKINFPKFKDAIVNYIMAVYILHHDEWLVGHGDIDTYDNICGAYTGITEYIAKHLHIDVVDDTEIVADNMEILYVPLCTFYDVDVKGLTYFIT